MNRKEELLGILQEECAEIIQAISKLSRFGDNERNRKDLKTELGDFFGVFKIIVDEGHLVVEPDEFQALAEAKIAKVEKYMKNKKAT